MQPVHNRPRGYATLLIEQIQNEPLLLGGSFQKMARRRYQKPTPQKRGDQWTILVREDVATTDGKRKRQVKRVNLGPITLTRAEVERLRDEYLVGVNQVISGIGGSCLFRDFARTYERDMLPALASTSRERSKSVLKNYLKPALGGLMLREITLEPLQGYFSKLQQSPLAFESVDKIRDVLSAVLRTAVDYGRLSSNPVEKIRLKRRHNKRKPFLRTEQFFSLLEAITEPYATMIYVAVFTALRVSELAALRWRNVGTHSITVEERYSRGDFDQPKSEASRATIPVAEHVTKRIERLKSLEVVFRAGRAQRRYKAVKADGPDDLVFQSVATGAAMRDNNILCRHIKPAARRLELDFVNWQVLRRSCATWLQQAGVDVKDAQGLMRHSRASTTQDVYQQVVPESQQDAVRRLTAYVEGLRKAS